LKSTVTIAEIRILEHTERVMAQFEAFCTVSQSVSQGIPIRLEVVDSDGKQLK
jgi:organic hydroperoxide reductase OsmC/OhrA